MGRIEEEAALQRLRDVRDRSCSCAELLAALRRVAALEIEVAHLRAQTWPSCVYIVIAGGIILDSYTRGDIAAIHRRSVTGADVVPCELHQGLTAAVRADVLEEWDSFDDDDTPVLDVPPPRDDE